MLPTGLTSACATPRRASEPHRQAGHQQRHWPTMLTSGSHLYRHTSREHQLDLATSRGTENQHTAWQHRGITCCREGFRYPQKRCMLTPAERRMEGDRKPRHGCFAVARAALPAKLIPPEFGAPKILRTLPSLSTHGPDRIRWFPRGRSKPPTSLCTQIQRPFPAENRKAVQPTCATLLGLNSI